MMGELWVEGRDGHGDYGGVGIEGGYDETGVVVGGTDVTEREVGSL